MGTPLDIVALTTALRLVALSMQDSIYSAHNLSDIAHLTRSAYIRFGEWHCWILATLYHAKYSKVSRGVVYNQRETHQARSRVYRHIWVVSNIVHHL